MVYAAPTPSRSPPTGWRDWVEDLIPKEFDAVTDEEPDQCVSPDEQGPSPAQRRHEQSVDRNERCQNLGAQDCHPQDAGGTDGPERAAGTGEEDRQVSGH